jgi:hypothetical protein
MAPMYLIGYMGGEPVYRTTNTLATGKHILKNYFKKVFLSRLGRDASGLFPVPLADIISRCTNG